MTAYIIKSSASLIILFGLYWLLLRKEKLFVFNRFFLITAIVFSLVLPFIAIPVNFRIAPQISDFAPVGNFSSPDVSSSDNTVNMVESSVGQGVVNRFPIRISSVLLVLYFSGTALFLFRFLRNIFRIARKSKLSEKTFLKGYRIVLTSDGTGPCCFFSNIFINRDDYLNGRIATELLEHEMEHARQHHTADIILVELLKIFYWFNPVNILYERAIRINHEYLADNGVINDKYDIQNYAEKLLSFIAGRNDMSLTSGSNYSFIRMRLLMMGKQASGKLISATRITSVLFAATALFLFLSFKESGNKTLLPDTSGTERGLTQNFSLRGSMDQDTLNKLHYQAKTIENSIDSNSNIITLRGNAIISIPDKDNTYDVIVADSATFNVRKHLIIAFNGTLASYKSGVSSASNSLSFDEMNFDLGSYKVLVKNVRSSTKISGPKPLYGKPSLFPIRESDLNSDGKPYISKGFGERRVKLGSVKDTLIFHYGIDIDVKYGTDVLATSAGKVISASWDDKGLGNLIEIYHGDGYVSRYAHLKDFNVRAGDFVTGGQVIGHSGSSGLSTGPHLHFEIRCNYKAVDPVEYLKTP